jgi:hypothetical protein
VTFLDLDRVRGLTVRQPWCQALVDGHKPVENRSQGFPKGWRGLVLLHAGRQVAVNGLVDGRIRRAYPLQRAWDTGVVLGVADLVDVHLAAGCCAPWGEETYLPANPEARPPGRVTHLVFERVVRLPTPVLAHGALGLWRPDQDLVVEVAHELAEMVTWDLERSRRLADEGELGQLHAVTGDFHQLARDMAEHLGAELDRG